MVTSIFKPPRDYSNFLQAVMCSDQAACAYYLSTDPGAVLTPMTAVDVSGREFCCSPIQYAFWAMDSELCKTLLQEVPVDCIPAQLADMQTRAFEHGPCIEIYKILHQLKENMSQSMFGCQLVMQLPVHMMRSMMLSSVVGYGYEHIRRLYSDMKMPKVRTVAEMQLAKLKLYVRTSQISIAVLTERIAKLSTYRSIK